MPTSITPEAIEQRFWAKVRKTSTCWLWTGKLNQGGYGILKVQGKQTRAHRYAYELLVGPIPEGLTIDHKCRVRRCVWPAHLEPVTRTENVRRGDGITARLQRRTHCKNGHPFNDHNTRWRADGRGRVCRTCSNERERQYYRLRRLQQQGRT